MYIENHDHMESLSIKLKDCVLLYCTFSSDDPCETHFWFRDKMTEEEYFQKSLISSVFTLSYEENVKVLQLISTVMEYATECDENRGVL
jgi:hypothetical protein